MIVGGLLIGTFFTLFVIPAVYTYLARKPASARRQGSVAPAVQTASE